MSTAIDAVFELIAADLGLHTSADLLVYADRLDTNLTFHDRCVLRWAAARMTDDDKRAKAHPRIVALQECPACHEFGVPPNEHPRFCLKCQWREPLPPLTE